jgi:hypothetical protein
MQRKDVYAIGILYLLMLLIFYPLFYTEYIYMDEAVQIWLMKPGTDYMLFLDDGRALTEWLQFPLFSAIDSIHAITYIRIISLVGWMICVPVWYWVIKRVINSKPEYEHLPFFSCLYMVTSLPFLVSVQWATCMQFFIAQTCGLLSGAVLYIGIRFTETRLRVSMVAVIASVLLGVAAMFFYQNAAGCFLIPFLLHFINQKATQKNKVLITALAVNMLVFVVYYILYRISMQVYNIPLIERNSIHIDVVDKIKWFLARPLERSFRFSVLAHEDSLVSKVYFALMLAAWALLALKRFGKANRLQAFTYLAVTMGIFFISYLPNLIIKENFASNRTMFALNMCVWLVCAEMVMHFVKNRSALLVTGIMIALVFVICARNNFRNAFLKPVQQETAALKNHIQQHYHNGTRTIHFIRPPEDFFVKKYHVHQSMDEIGIPQSFFVWVPDPLCRQLVYEKTHNRKATEQLVIRHWPDAASFARSGEPVDSTVLLVDVQAIMSAPKP